jgi:hypothetical protein
MKSIFVSLMMMLTLSFSVWSKETKDLTNSFNAELMRDVQKDIQSENDDQFKVKGRSERSIGRGPASISPVVPETEGNKKLEKLKQLGSNKW